MTLKTGTQSIETERLVLRRIEPGDIEYYAEIHADPEVARYIAHGRPRTRAESESWLDAILASYADCELGQLAVLSKATGQLVGRCGLSDAALEVETPGQSVRKGWFFRAQVPAEIEAVPVPELGYTFGRDNWGQGFASEAVRAIYDYTRRELPYHTIMSVIDKRNHASLAVASKFGVTYAGQVELSGALFDRYDWPMN